MICKSRLDYLYSLASLYLFSFYVKYSVYMTISATFPNKTKNCDDDCALTALLCLRDVFSVTPLFVNDLPKLQSNCTFFFRPTLSQYMNYWLGLVKLIRYFNLSTMSSTQQKTLWFDTEYLVSETARFHVVLMHVLHIGLICLFSIVWFQEIAMWNGFLYMIFVVLCYE